MQQAKTLGALPNSNIIPFLRGSTDQPLTVLAVEDNRLERLFLEKQISELGHQTLQAADGQQALNILMEQKGKIDVILMDRMMPVMDGLTAVRIIKDDPVLRRIPIVMVTGADRTIDMQEGIEAGVFYYLTKPVEENILRSVLSAAVREAQQNRNLNDELKRHKASFNLIHTAKFTYRTLEEAECLSAFIAHCFPNPDRVLPGLAELLINAVEHGNLGIGYDRKSELLEQGIWRAEINKRLEGNTRKAEAAVTRKEDGVYVVVTDEGDGFEWRKFMTIDPARAGHNHGRGIAQANTVSFDKLTFNPKGNQAVGFMGYQQDLEW